MGTVVVRRQTKCALWLCHPSWYSDVMIRQQQTVPMKYSPKNTARLWLGIDSLVPAGVDTVSVRRGPCQHWWQLGLTSSQNLPKSFTASVTSSVCGEFVMRDRCSGSINRHHCPPTPTPSQWRHELLLMQIFTEHMKEIHFLSDRPHTDTWKTRETRSSQERLCSGGRGGIDRHDLLPQLCFALAWGSCQHKL